MSFKALSVLCSACARSPAGSGASRPPHSAPNEAGNYYPGWGGEDDLPGSEGCHFPDEELFLRHGTAVSPGPEEEDSDRRHRRRSGPHRAHQACQDLRMPIVLDHGGLDARLEAPEVPPAPGGTGGLPKTRKRRRRRRRALLALGTSPALALGGALYLTRGPSETVLGIGNGRTVQVPSDATLSPLRAKIISIAESQIGYTTDPPGTYCNKYSGYWYSGADDCGNANLDEEWCADFAAWVWKQAGAAVTYQYVNGDLNSSAASFYEWGVARGTWHPAGSGYVPQPGDVAVYGLDTGETCSLPTQPSSSDTSPVTGGRRPSTATGTSPLSASSKCGLMSTWLTPTPQPQVRRCQATSPRATFPRT